MDKGTVIKKIHKILFVYENWGYCSYIQYLSKTIILLNGFNKQDVLIDTIFMLNGLKNMKDNVSHEDVRSIVLKIMNELDRKYLEV